MDILYPRTICYLCSDRAEILHDYSVPLCRVCDCRIRKHKGLEPMPNEHYKTEEQIGNEYEEYWKPIKELRIEMEQIKNESRTRTKHLRKDYCEKCKGTEKIEFHHIDYIRDKGETLCFDCHRKNQSLVLGKNKQYLIDVENLARQRIQARKNGWEKKQKEIEAEMREEALWKECFACKIKTNLLRANIPVCPSCDKKIGKRVWMGGL